MLARYYKILCFSLFYLSLFKYQNGSKYLPYPTQILCNIIFLDAFCLYFKLLRNYLTAQGLKFEEEKKHKLNTFKLEIIALYVKIKSLYFFNV